MEKIVVKKFATLAFAAAGSLALAACGSTTDASEDAIADDVEMPADQALIDTPEPVMDEAATLDAPEEEAMDVMEAADTAADMVAEDAAEAAAE
jgi:hypothetical protein